MKTMTTRIPRLRATSLMKRLRWIQRMTFTRDKDGRRQTVILLRKDSDLENLLREELTSRSAQREIIIGENREDLINIEAGLVLAIERELRLEKKSSETEFLNN